ncbi:MAG: hypothetical protein Q7S41_01095 [Candidatus Limnocylindria bacterium]|nr:hypothetical protein [Candidatus Limnocylindria bacterium]
MADKDKKDKKDKGKNEPQEAPVDLAARIGSRGAPELPPPPAPAPPAAPTQRLDGPLPPRVEPARRPSAERPTVIGMDEPARPPISVPPSQTDESLTKPSGAIQSPRTLPGPGEIDLVATPLPTPDDWHHFELALRKVRGVGQIRTEYYRHGVLKVRVTYEGEGRLAQALRAGVPGYRIRVLGEDRSTLQILVSTDNDERRPG